MKQTSSPKKSLSQKVRKSSPNEPGSAGQIKAVSWNVNGIRAVLKKGFANWFAGENADVVMLQEIKADEKVFAAEPELVEIGQHHHFAFACATKPGYSGLVTITKEKPTAIRQGLGIPKFDSEGRWLEVDIGNGKTEWTLINSYFPNSQREHTRLGYKLEFCKAAVERLNQLKREGRHVILAGDINVAHTEIDLANPKSNKDNAGFLPEERAWFSEFLTKGWVDAFREFEPGPGHYTWWSYRPGVRERNIGWRLDHFFVHAEDRARIRSVQHQPETLGSDHCPVVLVVKTLS